MFWVAVTICRDSHRPKMLCSKDPTQVMNGFILGKQGPDLQNQVLPKLDICLSCVIPMRKAFLLKASGA